MGHQNRSKITRREEDNPTPQMIRELRESRGMTQAEFGELGFYSEKSVIEWEDGTRRMHPMTWFAYQKKLQ